MGLKESLLRHQSFSPQQVTAVVFPFSVLKNRVWCPLGVLRTLAIFAPMGARARGLRELHPLRITLPRIADAARHGLKCRVLGSKALNQEGGCGPETGEDWTIEVVVCQVRESDPACDQDWQSLSDKPSG